MSLRCLDCGRIEYPLSMDLKCRHCETRASTQMLGFVVLAMLGAGAFGALWALSLMVGW